MKLSIPVRVTTDDIERALTEDKDFSDVFYTRNCPVSWALRKQGFVPRVRRNVIDLYGVADAVHMPVDVANFLRWFDDLFADGHFSEIRDNFVPFEFTLEVEED